MTLHRLIDKNFVPEGKPVFHGFFGRQGGVSSGLYSSLNCAIGSGDSKDAVYENRHRVIHTLNADHLATVYQVHSSDCFYVTQPWVTDDRPSVDAMVTDVPGLVLGILTADCGPVLFYGEKEGGDPVIGAAHSGWGGALKGVLENTVSKMKELGANDIHASIGPCIAQASYEVQMDFMGNFLNDDPMSERFFKSARRPGHLMFDLPGYIASRLAGAGVGHVSITGIDTYAQENDYFSYRRTTHRLEKEYGRQISALVIPD